MKDKQWLLRGGASWRQIAAMKLQGVKRKKSTVNEEGIESFLGPRDLVTFINGKQRVCRIASSYLSSPSTSPKLDGGRWRCV